MTAASWQARNLRYRLADCIILILLILLYIVLYFIHGHRRYVTPGDFTLRYPLVTEQVSAVWLFVLAVGLPLVVFTAFYWSKRHLRHAALEFQSLFLAFALCIIVNLLVTDTIKKITGRPRPNFFELTEWDDSKGGITTTSDSNLREAYQSFVSGHTSLSFAGLLFLSQFLFQHLSPLSPLYIAQSLAIHKTPVNKLMHTNNFFTLLIPMLPVLLAGWIGLTRIVDYWHFCEDVMGGALVGTFFAITTFNYCYLERKWTWLRLHPMPEAERSNGVITDGEGHAESEADYGISIGIKEEEEKHGLDIV